MQDTDIPAKFGHRWAYAAGGAYIRTVPDASQIGIQNGAASIHDGFPPNCFVPIAGGGSWPWGQDFNGVLNQITAWNQWQAAGGPVVWDSAFSTAIGGYPLGCIVASSTTASLWWTSTVENNVTNPDTGGAGWQRFPLSRSGEVVAADLEAGVAATNLGAAGGGLNGTYPNPQVNSGIAVFATAGTFTFTVPAPTIFVWGWGGGGGGSGNSGTTLGGNGGGGAFAFKRLTGLTVGSTINVTIAPLAGGGAASDGVTGGTCSFGVFFSVAGGGAGRTAFGGSTPGGAASAGVDFTMSGGESTPTVLGTSLFNVPLGLGGNSPLGGGGGCASNTAGQPGHWPGGGGGAGLSSLVGVIGGNGAIGGFIVRW